MANHPELSRLHQLVDIFSHKTLDAYLAFEQAQGQYLKELGVDQAASMETMRLLTLCTLAASAETLSYDAVAQALKVSPANQARAVHPLAANVPFCPRPSLDVANDFFRCEFLVSEVGIG